MATDPTSEEIPEISATAQETPSSTTDDAHLSNQNPDDSSDEGTSTTDAEENTTTGTEKETTSSSNNEGELRRELGENKKENLEMLMKHDKEKLLEKLQKDSSYRTYAKRHGITIDSLLDADITSESENQGGTTSEDIPAVVDISSEIIDKQTAALSLDATSKIAIEEKAKEIFEKSAGAVSESGAVAAAINELGHDIVGTVTQAPAPVGSLPIGGGGSGSSADNTPMDAKTWLNLSSQEQNAYEKRTGSYPVFK